MYSLNFRRLLILSIVPAFALVGCKPKGAVSHLHSAPPTALAGDEFLNSGEGFTIALPSTWKMLPAGSTPNPEAMFNISRPTLGFGGPTQPDADKSGNLALVDTSVKYVATDAPVMVRFESTKVSGGSNAAVEAEQYVSAMYDGDHKDVKPYPLPIGDAVEIVAKRHLVSGDAFYFVDFVVVDNEKVLKVKFVGNDAQNIKMTAEKAMETLRFDPAAHTKVQEVKEISTQDMLDQLKGMSQNGTPPPNPDGTSQ